MNIPESGNEGKTERKIFVHQNFRIWFIANEDGVNKIPGIVLSFRIKLKEKIVKYNFCWTESLVYDSAKIVPQISEMKQTYSTCKEIINTDKV